jgi:hypothetical protein
MIRLGGELYLHPAPGRHKALCLPGPNGLHASHLANQEGPRCPCRTLTCRTCTPPTT